jgi:hypothetical protein
VRKQALKQVKDSLPIHLIRTRNKYGEACFFVVRTSQAQFQKLMAKQKKESVNVADYGEILASGYGEKPTESVCIQLREQYGVTFKT